MPSRSHPFNVDINEIHRIVRAGSGELQAGKDKNIILLIGFTGEGKSTLINYLCGSRMYRMEGSDKVAADPELARIGQEMGLNSSKTLYPSFYTVQHASLPNTLLCDLAGLQDNRGDNIQAAISFMYETVVLNALSVKVVFVVSIHTIQVNRGEKIFQFLDHVAALLDTSQLVNDQFYLVVTKENDRFASENFRDRSAVVFEEFQQFRDSAIQAYFDLDVKLGGHSSKLYPSGVERHRLSKAKARQYKLQREQLGKEMVLLRSLLMSPQHFALVNVLDNGADRDNIFFQLAQLNPIHKNAFRFQLGDDARVAAEQLMHDICLKGLIFLDVKRKLVKQIYLSQASVNYCKKITQKIQVHRNQQTHSSISPEVISASSSEPYNTRLMKQQKIREMNHKINYLREQLFQKNKAFEKASRQEKKILVRNFANEIKCLEERLDGLVVRKNQLIGLTVSSRRQYVQDDLSEINRIYKNRLQACELNLVEFERKVRRLHDEHAHLLSDLLAMFSFSSLLAKKSNCLQKLLSKQAFILTTNVEMLSGNVTLEIPNFYLCPLAEENEKTPMLDPIILRCGHTFERANIVLYVKALQASLARSTQCPVASCTQMVDLGSFRPNIALLSAMSFWQESEIIKNGFHSNALSALSALPAEKLRLSSKISVLTSQLAFVEAVMLQNERRGKKSSETRELRHETKRVSENINHQPRRGKKRSSGRAVRRSSTSATPHHTAMPKQHRPSATRESKRSSSKRFSNSSSHRASTRRSQSVSDSLYADIVDLTKGMVSNGIQFFTGNNSTETKPAAHSRQYR